MATRRAERALDGAGRYMAVHARIAERHLASVSTVGVTRWVSLGGLAWEGRQGWQARLPGARRQRGRRAARAWLIRGWMGFQRPAARSDPRLGPRHRSRCRCHPCDFRFCFSSLSSPLLILLLSLLLSSPLLLFVFSFAVLVIAALLKAPALRS